MKNEEQNEERKFLPNDSYIREMLAYIYIVYVKEKNKYVCMLHTRACVIRICICNDNSLLSMRIRDVGVCIFFLLDVRA